MFAYRNGPLIEDPMTNWLGLAWFGLLLGLSGFGLAWFGLVCVLTVARCQKHNNDEMFTEFASNCTRMRAKTQH